MDRWILKFNMTARIKRVFSGPRLWIVFCVLLISFPAAGCVSPAGMATIPFIPLDKTVTMRPPSQNLPISTATKQGMSDVTPTPAPSITNTPYGGIDFSQVDITLGGFLSDFGYFVAFTFPDPVRGDFHAMVDKNKPYKCVVLPDYPSRLYCNGPLVVVDNWADIELYAGDQEEPVWSGKFFVPLMK